MARWYNNNKGTNIHTSITGMIGLASYLVMSIPVKDASGISFVISGVVGLFGAMIISILSAEIFIKLSSTKKLVNYVNDDPEVAVPQAFVSVLPAMIVVFIFVGLRILLVASGIEAGLTDITNYILRKPYETNSQSLGTAILYNLSTHIMWLFGIHGNNVLDSVAKEVFAHAGSSRIITKTFFDVFVYMGGSGTTLALLIALFLFGRNKSHRTLFKFALPNSIFNINEPLVFGIPIVLNPIYAIPFVLTPSLMFLTTYLGIKMGFVSPIINEVSWATPVFISGYIATGSISGILLQVFNLLIAVAIYTPFVLLSERLSQLHFKASYKNLLDLVTTEYSTSSRRLLARVDGMGAVARRLANELEGAIGSHDMFLNYQPIIDVRNKKVHSVEALLRWKHPVHGMVNPMLVIALAEETHLIDRLGLWVIQEAVRQRGLWTEEDLPDFKVAVNVSSQQLNSTNFYKQVLTILKDNNVPTHQLKVEITETQALVENQATRGNLLNLNEAGVSIAMDDFGVGHSSLIYLQTMPISTIKIDGSLSREIVDQPINLDIITAIYDLCHLMRMETVVEYVENEEQLEKLMEVGDFLIQGYLFSPPRLASDLGQFIRQFGNIPFASSPTNS